MLNRLFGEKKEVKEIVKEDVTEKKLNISEPIYSFVECVKNDPRRFKFDSEHSGYYYDHYAWTLIDSVAEELFEGGLGMRLSVKGKEWITEDEARYMTEELFYKIHLRYRDLMSKKDAIRKKIRARKKGAGERQKYEEIYCKKL